MITEPIVTYEEAVQRIQTAGLLPLAPLFPGFPSLSSLTPSENWHTDSPLDPWLWRSRLAEEGAAAYGKFVKKKAVLISRECFPWVHRLLSDSRTIQDSMMPACSLVTHSSSMSESKIRKALMDEHFVHRLVSAPRKIRSHSIKGYWIFRAVQPLSLAEPGKRKVSQKAKWLGTVLLMRRQVTG